MLYNMKKSIVTLIAIIFIASPFLSAQQIKSMDEIDRESFKAGMAPLERKSVNVELKEGSFDIIKENGSILLDGDWQLIEGGKENDRLNNAWTNFIPAKVPGSVHAALWKAGIIPDPYFARNDTIAEKNSYKTWWYKKEFDVEDKLIMPKLVFEGVAMKCNVWLNDVYLGEHDGMFGGPEYDVAKVLKKHNVLIVKINPAPYQISDEEGFFHGLNIGWRKEVVFNCVYGWHYSNIPSIGIWRSVKINNQKGVVISSPFIATKSLDGSMDMQVILKKAACNLSGKLSVLIQPFNFEGKPQYFIYVVSTKENSDTLNFTFKINNPRLWWPNDMGEQNLYDLKISFDAGDKNNVTTSETTFGIRTVTMAPLPGGPYADKLNWTFVINGKPHFVKGNGWCTMDPLMNFTRERYDRFLSLAKLQHIQMMRAWGCGLPETDDFYELCDKYGIMIMQEWPTAWNSHNDQPYDVLKETVELNTIRIRNHPSLVMYGGGNESSKPFGPAMEMIGRASIELDGTRPFHRSEPWGGSKHNYNCWWKNAPLDHNLNMTASFWGEFGIAAFPVKESVLKYLPENEKTIWPPDSTSSFAHHTPTFNAKGDMSRSTQYAGYVMPLENMDDMIIGSQLAQVVAVRHTLERARTRWPECSGALYYKMNDNFPAESWSCVDWYGAPKPLHYFAMDAFAPVAAVILFEHTDMSGQDVSLPVYLLDDNQALAGKNWAVNIRAYNKSLELVKKEEYKGYDSKVYNKKLDNFSLSAEQTKTNPLLFVSEVYSEDTLLFRTFYYMNFEKDKGCIFKLPKTSLTMQVTDGKAVIKNTGRYPAVGVNVQAPGNSDKFTATDNYFWLDTNESKTVDVNITKNLTIDSWNCELK